MTTIDGDSISEQGALARAGHAAALRWLWPDVLVVGAIALAVRLAQLEHPPHFDELYHLLAAQGWLDSGTFAIADGVYTRAWHFTVLVAGAIAMLGESLAAARVPSVIFGTLWVLAVFFWTRKYAGRAAGLLAGLVFAFDPGAIDLSQLVRFYALHGLAFWILAISVFALTQRPIGWSRAVLGTAAVASGILAFSLQITTLIGLAGLTIWVAIHHGPEQLRRARHEPRARWVVAGVVALVVLGAAGALLSGAAAEMWAKYRSAALWAAGNRDNIVWYHRWLTERFAGFWALFPVAALIATHRFRAPAVFSVVVFSVALVLHSGAGFKAERYFYYAMPFFFILWAMALTAVAPAIRRLTEDVVARFAPARPARSITFAALAAALLFALYTTPVNYVARRMVFPDEGWRPYPQPDWAAASQVLEPIADSADVVVSASLPKALYFFGHADVALGVTELVELAPRGTIPSEFTIDPRTGRPSIGSPGSLASLMTDYATGLVVVERQQWQRDCCVTPAVAKFLLAKTEPVQLCEAWGLLAFRWRRPGQP